MWKTPRIAITGIGMISPLGVLLSDNWGNLLNGISGIDTIRKFDTSDCLTRIGGQLPASFYEMEKINFNRHSFKQTLRTTRIASLISKEAIQDSGLNLKTMDLKRCGVVLGTSGAFLDEDDSSGWIRNISNCQRNGKCTACSDQFGFGIPGTELFIDSVK